MLRYALSRVLQGLLVLFGAVVISFVLTNLSGSPADVIGGNILPPDVRREIAAQLGYDEPLLVRLGEYLVNVAQGDLGVSYRGGTPALTMVLDALPNTVILVAGAIAAALLVAIPLSVFSVLRRGSAADRHLRNILMLLGSLPDYWVGLVLVLLLSVNLALLPSIGFDGVSSLVLPVLALALPIIPAFVRLLRGSLLDVAEQDFVTGLRAKGFTEREIVVRHGLKNASVPFITLLALQIGWLLGGTIVVEVVFAWPGVGSLLIDAVAVRDIAPVQATVVVLACAYVLLNLAADLVVALIDPRIRMESG